ncbi:flagellar basal-body MS-ring/collar protein FliF [Brockia lithotrophica]|uniref:Flagellar M-ring protein n=1 Tax=Brockia lithotrophica TaxID=933949 RepID=A0A660L0T7_9BACL|nr:flagellar basal-body MS-ring/collar protein FliF [Brockia lithotrophica]RKQ84189.1 flagellar M-ring protein FliF [Brockia lithotrophica]
MGEIGQSIRQIASRLVSWYGSLSRGARIVGIFGIVFFFLLLVYLLYAVKHVDYVPTYRNLSERETGEIAARLKELGVRYRITADGRGIDVERDRATEVKVALAKEGIPHQGTITLEDLLKGSPFGYSEREFNALTREARQNALRNLLVRGIRGIRDAQVLLVEPEPSIWVSDTPRSASASVVLTLEPGVVLTPEQVRAIYHLIAHSVPNLPVENIALTDQSGRLLDPGDGVGGVDQLLAVRRRLEQETQQSIERLLAPMLAGRGEATVQVTLALDFSKEQREEQRVEPQGSGDTGVVLSRETQEETWKGGPPPAAGVPGVGANEPPTYQAPAGGGGGGEGSRRSERVNYEVTRVHQIREAQPFRVRSVAVNVAVGLPDPTAPEAQRLKEDIQAAVGQVAGALVDTPGGSAQATVLLYARTSHPAQAPGAAPGGWPGGVWVWAFGAGLLLLLAGGLFFLRRRREEVSVPPPSAVEVPPKEAARSEEPLVLEVTDEERMLRQLARLAEERPKEFAQILRAWLKEEA